MSRPTLALAVLLLTQGLAPSCPAQVILGAAQNPAGPSAAQRAANCTVLELDAATLNFACGDRVASRRYWVTRATRFVSSRPNASFFDLTPGEPLRVTSHRSGRFDIADVVRY
ncbi:MAG TPA: hypothetical protein VHY79_10685 [Rhizomicrobium sp.]|jgi:hypothetical protein|nr:hypothetical protein [Rhizomicrobium sp.]